LKRKRILGFWDSGIQEEKNIARGSRGLARIEEEENSGILGFWNSGRKEYCPRITRIGAD
jgi:hypothetical protein